MLGIHAYLLSLRETTHFRLVYKMIKDFDNDNMRPRSYVALCSYTAIQSYAPLSHRMPTSLFSDVFHAFPSGQLRRLQRSYAKELRSSRVCSPSWNALPMLLDEGIVNLWTPFLQSKKNRCHPKLRRHGFVWFAVLLIWRKSKKEHVLRVRLNNIEHDVFAHQTLALRTKESVLDRHWKEMFDRMGDSAPKPALYGNDYKKVTLQMMLDHNINEFTQDFEELSTAAAKQHGLKKAMGNMKVGHGFADKLGRIWAYLGMFVPKQQDDWYQSVPFILHIHAYTLDIPWFLRVSSLEFNQIAELGVS